MRWVILVTGVTGILGGIMGTRWVQETFPAPGVVARSQVPDGAASVEGGNAELRPHGPDSDVGGRQPAGTATALVHHCHDGDTCRLGFGPGQSVWLNVRLAGIDAPEVKGRGGAGQPLGDAAREAINAAAKGQVVSVRQLDLDSYNRPIVELAADGRLLNLELVEQGLAEVYRGATKRLDQTPYLAAEERARAAKRGIWGLADYVSPKAYRKRSH